ncbi:toxic anion resistance protein [Viridibacillus arvi]|uniref:toxic anion resistance protein n=1 Tax=Viridibacillus arvi TaxID=263475 RepID=UPI0034CDC488
MNEIEQLENPNNAKLALREDPMVLELVKKIDSNDQIAVLEFGKETASGISTFSDRMLGSMRASKLEESGILLKNLNKVMDKFEPQDFAEDTGFFSKIFGRGKKFFEKALAKYESMGKEIDNIYIEIKKYEVEMKKNTTQLEDLYKENFNYFQELGKYAVAAQLKADELRGILPSLEEKASKGNQLAALELESTNNVIQLLEQRSFDLEMAQQVSFQSAPQIRLMQQGNNKLIGKINSAFITTIPIFKQGLITAVSAKQQSLVAESMSGLDRRTNELLRKNAENIRQNSVDIARLAGSPSISLETMEETWRTIMSGIQETKQIEDDTRKSREYGRKRIQLLQDEYQKLKQM